MEDEHTEDPIPVEYPINGTLDLHVFKPSDIPSVLNEYINACIEKKIYQLRVIHGKGKGVQRKRVSELLAADKRVAGFKTAGEDGGGWGATLVNLVK
jgi:DNA-nicking Smr family endonuclease